MMIGFNGAELRQDLGLGIAFIFLTVFSSLRILRSFSSPNGRKVITTFNSLIFISALSRAVWFLIPNYFLEGSYIPSAVVAYESPKWLGALISELLLAIGSLSLYGVFILVACYWIYMLTKLNSPTAASYDEVAHRNRNGSNMSGIMSSGSIGSSSSNGTNGRSSLQNLVRHRWATLELFGIAMAVAVSLQVLGVCLFLNQTFNSQQMVMYDSVLLSVLSLSIVITITLLSQHIKTVLQNLEAMNNRNSQPQIRRIFAIIIVANVFFVTRVILELTLTICFAVMMKGAMLDV